MSTQIPFSADGIKTTTSIVGETFNFTDGEEVSLRPQLRKVGGNLVATTNIVMSSNISGYVATSENGGNEDIWFNAATGDADGNIYVVGDDDDVGRGTVYAFNPAGGLRWKVEMDQVDGYNTESYAIELANDQVKIGFRSYDGTSDQVGILKLNPVDGTVIDSVRLSSPVNANPRINAMATKSDGDQIIVGEIYGEYNTVTNLTAQTPSGPGVLWVNNSDIPVSTDNGNWEIEAGGTWWGLNSKNQITVPTETITGVGTDMTVYIQWSTQTNSYGYISISYQGTGYVVPDRVRVRGNLLGGTDNTDITATATSASDVGANTVAVYDKATYPTMGSIQAGWHIIFPSGLDYEVVSVTDAGSTWEVTVPSNGVDFSGPGMYSGGGNDLFLYLYTTWWGGTEIQQLFTVPAAGKARFEISDQNDFSTGGPYSIRYSLDAQAYIWTPSWQHTYGGIDWQAFKDVAVSTADDIYLLGRFNKEINSNWYNTLVMKLDTNGDVQWSKYVEDSTATQGNEGSICVDLDGNVFVVAENDNGYTVITKLDSSGSVIWQVRQTNDSNWDNEPRAAIDADGNLYVSGAWYNGNYDVVSVMKINGSDGSLLWARYLGNTEEYGMREFYDDECQPMKVVGTNIYYCCYTDDSNDDCKVGLAVRLSTDGSGMGTFGRWVYSEDTDAAFETSTSDAVVIDSGYTSPTDGVTQGISGNSASVSPRNVSGEFETNEPFGAGAGALYDVTSIRWADGTTQNTFHHKHGNYSFDENTFNIPDEAIFEGQDNELTVNLNRIQFNLGYQHRIDTNSVWIQANNSYYLNSNTITIGGYNTDVIGSNNTKITGSNSVIITNNNQNNWSFSNLIMSYPVSMASRMQVQGAVTTVMGDTIAASGHAGYISGQQFYVASSPAIHAVKITAKITMESGVGAGGLQAFLLEYMFVRDYSGGVGVANRVNDVVTASRVGHASTVVETTESSLVGSIDAQGKLQVRVNMMTGGNSGTLIYTATEFEAPDPDQYIIGML